MLTILLDLKIMLGGVELIMKSSSVLFKTNPLFYPRFFLHFFFFFSFLFFFHFSFSSISLLFLSLILSFSSQDLSKIIATSMMTDPEDNCASSSALNVDFDELVSRVDILAKLLIENMDTMPPKRLEKIREKVPATPSWYQVCYGKRKKKKKKEKEEKEEKKEEKEEEEKKKKKKKKKKRKKQKKKKKITYDFFPSLIFSLSQSFPSLFLGPLPPRFIPSCPPNLSRSPKIPRHCRSSK